MGHKIFEMTFSSVFPCLIAKVERKGGTASSVYAITAWMTGYSEQELEQFMSSDLTYGQFFAQAPAYNPKRENITGKICGVTIQDIQDPIMLEIRRLDKLVDWLAKGKTVEEVVAKYE